MKEKKEYDLLRGINRESWFINAEDIYETLCLLLQCKGRQADIMFHICRYDMQTSRYA